MGKEITKRLYHGSAEVVKDPKVLKKGHPKDFGEAFYVTAIKSQAEKWALRKGQFQGFGIVNEYELDYDKVTTTLKAKIYKQPNREWLDFVAKSRSGKQNDYDLIEGPVSDDRLYALVELYLTGEISYELFSERAKFRQETHQIALKEEALKCLTFVSYYEVWPESGEEDV